MLIKQDDYFTGLPGAAHNKSTHWKEQHYHTTQCHRCTFRGLCVLLMVIWCIEMIVARSCGPALCVFILRHHFMMQHDSTRHYVSRTCRRSWKHPSSCMASILTRHVSHWAWLGCSCTSTLVMTKIHWTVLPVTRLPPKLPVKKLHHQSWYATPVTGRWKNKNAQI